MTGVPTNLTPLELMELRFNAQSRGDFTAIYHSSHRMSTLRRSFTSLNEYLAYASEQLSGQITIYSYELLADQVADKKAHVLSRVSISVQGRTESFVEVAELRRSVMGWRFLHCARLPDQLLPEDPALADIRQLAAHPRAVVY